MWRRPMRASSARGGPVAGTPSTTCPPPPPRTPPAENSWGPPPPLATWHRAWRSSTSTSQAMREKDRRRSRILQPKNRRVKLRTTNWILDDVTPISSNSPPPSWSWATKRLCQRHE